MYVQDAGQRSQHRRRLALPEQEIPLETLELLRRHGLLTELRKVNAHGVHVGRSVAHTEFWASRAMKSQHILYDRLIHL